MKGLYLCTIEKSLSENTGQLDNIKDDYEKSNQRRDDLEQYLLQEKNIVEKEYNFSLCLNITNEYFYYMGFCNQ